VCRGETGHCRSTRRQEKLSSTGAEVLGIHNFLSLRFLESLIHTQSAEISRTSEVFFNHIRHSDYYRTVYHLLWAWGSVVVKALRY